MASAHDFTFTGIDHKPIDLKQYAGKPVAKQMYPEWRGGYYYAAKPKNNSSAPLALLYVSRWSSADKASQFASIYAKSLKNRYKEAAEQGEPAPGKAKQITEAKIDQLSGRHSWTTEEGTVVIEQQGETVLVSESLDAATTSTLEKEVFAK